MESDNNNESSVETELDSEFEIFLGKEDFKFNCAHFIAYKGFRERLHGHNYRVSITVRGNSGAILNNDGYLIDFADIKKAARSICKGLNEYFICPMKSDALIITENDQQLCIECEDGSKFSFPRSDCALLPLYHSSTEELSQYIYAQLVRKIGLEKLQNRGINVLEISVAEAPAQAAVFRCKLPKDEAGLQQIEKIRMKTIPRSCNI